MMVVGWLLNVASSVALLVLASAETHGIREHDAHHSHVVEVEVDPAGESRAIRSEEHRVVLRSHVPEKSVVDKHVSANVVQKLAQDPSCPTLDENPLKTTRTVRVISDLHVGGCWFRDPLIHKELREFFEDILDDGQKTGIPVDELVLNGDIFEFHLDALNEPQTSPEIKFADEDAAGLNMPEFLALVKSVSEKVPTYLVRGNHDEEMNEDLIRKGLGKCVHFKGNGFPKYGIWFEHGHHADLWNKVTTTKDKKLLLPFGYYVSRATTTAKNWCGVPVHLGKDLNPLQTAADFMMKKVLPGVPTQLDDATISLMEREWKNAQMLLLEAALGKKLQNVEELKQYPVKGANAHEIRWNDDSSDYTLYDALIDHQKQFRETVERKSPGAAHAILHALMLDLSKWASRDTTHDVVTAGHTHEPVLMELVRAAKAKPGVNEKVVYVNSGGWVKSAAGKNSKTWIDFTIGKVKQDVNTQASEAAVVRTAAGVDQPTEWRVCKCEIYEYDNDGGKLRNDKEIRACAE